MEGEVFIQVIDILFFEAETLLQNDDFDGAIRKFDAIIDETKAILHQKGNTVRYTLTGFGTAMGVALPGIGNLIGGLVGAGLGYYCSKLITGIAEKEGPLAEIIRIAEYGKVEATVAKRRLKMRRRGELPADFPVRPQNVDTAYRLWNDLQKDLIKQ